MRRAFVVVVLGEMGRSENVHVVVSVLCVSLTAELHKGVTARTNSNREEASLSDRFDFERAR